MGKIVQEITFNNNYPKLKGEKFARLIAVFNDMTGELLRQKFFKFIYDRKISHKFRDCVKTYLYDFGFRINW